MADVVQAVLTATDKNYTSTMQKAMGVTDSFASKLKSGLGFGAWVAVGTKAVNTVFNAIGSGVDGAVKRFDTLNNFPKTMQSLGFSAKEAQDGIDKLADHIDHLPTTLDAVASQAQQFVPMTGNIEKATDVTLALNNAMAAGGKDAATQQRAIEQWTKAMAKGKPDFEMWQSMVQTAPAQMDQLAKSMLGAEKNQNDLYEAMKSGSISIDEVNDKMIELTNASEGFDIAGKHYDNFAEQAKNASAGIGMAMVNTNAAVQRNIEKIIRAFDKKMSGEDGGGLVASLMKLPDIIDNVGGKIISKIEGITDLKSAFMTLATGIGTAALAVEIGSSAMIPSLTTLGNVGRGTGAKILTFAKDFKTGFVQGLVDAGATVPTLLKGLLEKFSIFGAGISKAMNALGIIMKIGLSALAPAVLIGGLIAGLGVLDTAFGTEIDNIINTVKTKGPEIITNLGTSITSRLPELMSRGAEMLTSLIEGIAANIPAIIQQGTNIIVTLVQGVVAAIPQLIPAAFNAIGQFLIGIAQALPQLITVGLQVISTLVSSIAQNLPQLIQSAFTAIAQFAVGIIQNLPQILVAGAEILISLCKGILLAIVNIPATIKSVFGAIKDAIAGNKGDIESAGEDQGQALTGSVAKSAAHNQSAVSAVGQETGESFASGLDGVIGGLSIDMGSVENSFSSVTPEAESSGKESGASFGSGLNSGIAGTTVNMSSVAQSLNSAAPTAQSAGTKVGQSFSKGISSTAGQARTAGTNAGKNFSTGAQSVASQAQNAGRQTGQRYVSGIRSQQGQVSSASRAMANAATSGLGSGYGRAYSAGAQISRGMAAGMYSCLGAIRSAAASMVSAANTAMRAKAMIHSPSKLTAKTGSFIGKGVVVGLTKTIKSVDSTGGALITSLTKTMNSAVKKGNFESMGKSVANKLSAGVTKKIKNMDNAFNSAVKAISNATSKMKKQIDKQAKAIGAKASLKETLKNQVTKNSNAAKTILQNLKKQLDTAYDKALKSSMTKIENLGKKYQEKYDAIIAARNEFAGSLKNIELFTEDDNGKIKLVDFVDEQIQVNKLSNNLTKLKKLLPKGMMDEIVSMNTIDALTYTNELLKKSDSAIRAYGNQWSAFTNRSDAIAKSFYADRVATLKTQYTQAVQKEFNSLKTKMNTIGQQVVQGFANGMKKKKGSLDKQTLALVNSVIATAKKKLKIKSPSKVFREIGGYTGEGLAIGLDRTQRDVQSSISNLLQAADWERQMAGRRFSGSLSDEYDYNVSARYHIEVPVMVNGREFARATADDMQDVINQKETYANRKRGIR